MRALFFFLLLSSEVFAAPDGACDEVTITTGDLDYQCDTLDIGPGTHIVPAGAAGQVLRIDVVGDVNISSGAVIVLSGGNGTPASDATPGGVAGPGGSDGGDNTNGGPNDAPDTPNGGAQGASDGPTCGGGGGGGGFSTNGISGTDCSGIAGGLRGDAYTLLATVFRGGYGGGAGGSPSVANPILSATGGGGGGAIWITANGNITINGNIDVRGGNGGSAAAASNAGGGGGGSAGAIRITSLSQLVNNGTFLFSGGVGGNGNGAGKKGGNGSVGIYELQDADNVIYGTGTGATALPATTETLHSSISCGSVKMKDQNLFYQMMLGFSFVVLISRIRGRSRRSV